MTTLTLSSTQGATTPPLPAPTATRRSLLDVLAALRQTRSFCSRNPRRSMSNVYVRMTPQDVMGLVHGASNPNFIQCSAIDDLQRPLVSSDVVQLCSVAHTSHVVHLAGTTSPFGRYLLISQYQRSTDLLLSNYPLNSLAIISLPLLVTYPLYFNFPQLWLRNLAAHIQTDFLGNLR
jgi:hypothetical protein